MTRSFIGFYWSHVGYVALTLALLALACLLTLRRRGEVRDQPPVVRAFVVLLVGLFFAGLAMTLERMIDWG